MKHTASLFGCLLAGVALLGCHPTSPSGPVSSTTTSSGSTPGESEVTEVSNAKKETPVEQSAAKSKQEIERIDFEDLNCNIQANLVFRDWMLTPRAKELDGQRVRLGGFILPDLRTEGIEEFVLLKNTECKFGQNGQADHLTRVEMNEGTSASYSDKAVDVIGTLHYEPFTGVDGNTWAIYKIEAEAVRPMRR